MAEIENKSEKQKKIKESLEKEFEDDAKKSQEACNTFKCENY
jgi:hypothetical protein